MSWQEKFNLLLANRNQRQQVFEWLEASAGPQLRASRYDM